MSARPIIVGAGPAGLSAAIELARHAVPSVLIDEAPRPGGVVYRGPLREGVSLDYLGDSYRQAMMALHADFAARRALIDLRTATRVIDAEAAVLSTLDERDSLGTIPFEHLLLATGCHELSVPFPGWMLPGVMLLGGLQLQIKSGVVKPNAPVAIVGTGPLLPLVACQLCRAGVAVAGVFEASSFRNLARETVALLNQPRLLLQGLSMLAFLKRRGVPMRYGWGIVEARGDATVTHAVVAPYGHDWVPDRSRVQTLRVGALAVGYGFLPRTQLSQLLGIEHACRDDGVLAPVVDASQRSSRPDIHVAGDLGGIQGGQAAMLQGRIAALGILRQMGVISADEAVAGEGRLRGALDRLRRFRAGFERASSPGKGLLDLPRLDTPICRCENVSSGCIAAALDQGVQDLISLKMRTRVGMGDCQGKVCIGHCIERLRQATGRSDVGWMRPRFPLDPLPFGAFAQTTGDRP